MGNNPTYFTLKDKTKVIVKALRNKKFDFEMILSNGNRKTFLWWYGSNFNFKDKNGNTDNRIIEALNKFSSI